MVVPFMLSFPRLSIRILLLWRLKDPMLLYQAPAAAVVFPREVNKRVKQDARITNLQEKIAKASSETTVKLRQELNDLSQEVMLENEEKWP